MPFDQSIGIRPRLPARCGGVGFDFDYPSGSFPSAAQPTGTFGVATSRERRRPKRMEAAHSGKLSTDRWPAVYQYGSSRTATAWTNQDTGRDPG
jgi:hypothetical protein